MKRRMGLTGEQSNHKVAGIFRDPERVQKCREEILDSAGELEEQLEHLKPDDETPAWLLEPESRGIWHTMVRAHLWLALAGVVVAGLVFALLMALDVAFVAQNPWTSLTLLVIFCAIGGAMLGGFVTIRPDHTPYIARVRSALEDNRHVLVVHATEQKQASAARTCLDRYADETVSTL